MELSFQNGSNTTAPGEYGGHTPLYERLRQALVRDIMTAPPEMEYLPYGREIMKKYGVSKNTVYRALEKLDSDGYIRLSRRAGSRILKRTLDAHCPVPSREGMAGCLGYILANNKPDSANRSDIRWHLVDEAESVFFRKGVRMVVYNLREGDWRFWTPEKIYESLINNGIRQVVFALPDSFASYPYLKLHMLLLDKGIRVILSFQDLPCRDVAGDFLLPGTSYTAVNTLPILASSLEQHYSGMEFKRFLFVSNECHGDFANPRANVCRRFAERHGIPFEHIRALYMSPHTEDFVVRPNLMDAKTAETIRRYLAAPGRALCMFANDEIGARLLSMIPRPENCEFIGYDNSPLAAEHGISTIGFNMYARAKALMTLYTEEHADIRGIVTGGRFIDRRQQKQGGLFK